MGRTAVLVEAARAKALRERVVHHGVRCDVPGEIATALEAGLGVVEIRPVKVERESWIVASTGGHAALEAAKTRKDTAGRGVVEAEMTRARRQRQYLRNQVVVNGCEERRLFGFAHGVLIEGGGGGINPWIRDGRPGKSAYVCEAAAVARRSWRPVCGTRRNGLVIPPRLVEQCVVLPKHAANRAQAPFVRSAQPEFVLLMCIAFD